MLSLYGKTNKGFTITFPVKLTDAAREKAWNLLVSQGREDLRLRVQVSSGGCSGLVYKFYFDDQSFDGDITESFDNLEVVIDKMSTPYLDGATVDFHDSLEKQGFSIDNPNASGSCACGDSFN